MRRAERELKETEAQRYGEVGHHGALWVKVLSRHLKHIVQTFFTASTTTYVLHYDLKLINPFCPSQGEQGPHGEPGERGIRVFV